MSRISFRKAGTMVALALVGVWGLTLGNEAEEATTAGGLVKDGNPPGLFLLYTGDVIGYVHPCG